MKEITITLFVSPEKLTLSSHLDDDHKHRAFLQALGRQVYYAASFGEPDRDVTMRGGIDADESGIEICFTYRLKDEERGFTMAAVSRKDGTEYSYHS